MKSFLFFSFLLCIMQLGILKVQGSEASSQVMSETDFSNLLKRMSKKTKTWYGLKDLDSLRGALSGRINGLHAPFFGEIRSIFQDFDLDTWLDLLIPVINRLASDPRINRKETRELFEIVDDLNIFLEHANQHLKEVNGRWFRGPYEFQLKDGPAPPPLINMREPLKNIPLISAIVISSSLFLVAKYLISSKRKTTIKNVTP